MPHRNSTRSKPDALCAKSSQRPAALAWAARKTGVGGQRARPIERSIWRTLSRVTPQSVDLSQSGRRRDGPEFPDDRHTSRDVSDPGHGRGGQGVVSGAEMLSVAAFLEGRYAQAFPSFGSERMGAPVMAFCRIDDKEIRLREPVLEPDALIIQDATLLHRWICSAACRHEGTSCSTRRRASTNWARWICAGVSNISVHAPCHRTRAEHVGRSVPNAALLGGFAAITGVIALKSVLAAIREKFPRLSPRRMSPLRRKLSTSQPKRERRSMLKQTEGSRGRRGRRALPTASHLRLSDPRRHISSRAWAKS